MRSSVVAAIAGAVALAAAAPAADAADAGCFWVGPYASSRGPAYNAAFPDSGAVYWTARYTTPPGAKLTLNGRFAHARYQSLNSYDATTAASIDGLNDAATKPARGSVNPFRAGADRTARRRNYSVTVAASPLPASGKHAANTLYAGVAGQPDQELIYRVYVPDRGQGDTGGAGLPEPVLTLADGTVKRGAAVCAAVGSSDNVLPPAVLPMPFYLSLRDAPGHWPQFPARDPLRWRAYYSTQFTIDCTYRLDCEPHPERIGGVYSNHDNNYVGAFVNRSYGPVLVLRGKLPRTPKTLAGEHRMGSGQMRYWSLCQNESLATTASAGCLYDEQVPVDSKGYYTIVTSKPADRPDNAVRRCGVGYIPWPKRGDGAGHLDDGLLLQRNMLPAHDFGHAVQDTKAPGDERRIMGDYLPRSTYMTKAEFESRGC